MKTNILAFITFSLISSSVSSAQAASLSFNLNDFTGTDAEVKITLNDAIAGANTVRVTAAVDSSQTKNIGDIVGLFFNLKDNSLIPNLSIASVSQTPGSPLTVSTSTGSNQLFLDNSGSTTDNFKKVDNNVNLNGDRVQRDFEVAVQIGNGGLGKNDDYQFVSFDLKANGLDLADFGNESFGVRLQSVGTLKSSRGESSKLEGQIPPYSPPPKPPVTEIPEPSTAAAIGLFALSLLRLRRRKSH